MPPHSDLPARFWSKADKSAGACGCWPWRGAVKGRGYGGFGGQQYAHRAAYEHAVGPIPEGMFVCHACDNPACVNPAHLFVGTALDNARDMSRKGRATRYNSTKTHCSKGHEFTPENTYVVQRPGRVGHRECKECNRACARERYRRKKRRRTT